MKSTLATIQTQVFDYNMLLSIVPLTVNWFDHLLVHSVGMHV